MRCIVSVSTVLLAALPAAGAPIQWSTADGGNGHYYDMVLTPERINWDVANSLATASTFLGAQGYLATITSDGENTFLRETFGPLLSIVPHSESPFDVDSVWIGLTDVEEEGNFVWVTGEPFDYDDWGPIEPNNLGNEDHVMIWKMNSTWEWIDALNIPEEGYIVEFDVVPEASSILMTSLALGGGLLWFRRRK